MSPLRVLVAGAGRAGMVHARNFAAGIPDAVLGGVADPSPQALAAAESELGCQTFPDPLAAVGYDSFDAVVIATPTPAHADLSVSALGSGKHVLSEKPLAPNLEDARRIVAAAEAAGVVFMMGFMRRYDPGFKRAFQLVSDGGIGEPLMVRSTTRGPGLPPEWAWDISRSGGLVAEVNSHDIDTVRWVTGQEFTSVIAAGRAAKRPDLAEAHPGFVDLLAVQAELSGGALAHVDGACPASYAYDARMEVYGSEGVVFAGSPVEGPLLVRQGEARRDPVSGWARLFAEAYRAEDTSFAAMCLGEGADAHPGVDDGLRALEVVVAVNRSLAMSSPVALDSS